MLITDDAKGLARLPQALIDCLDVDQTSWRWGGTNSLAGEILAFPRTQQFGALAPRLADDGPTIWAALARHDCGVHTRAQHEKYNGFVSPTQKLASRRLLLQPHANPATRIAI